MVHWYGFNLSHLGVLLFLLGLGFFSPFVWFCLFWDLVFWFILMVDLFLNCSYSLLPRQEGN